MSMLKVACEDQRLYLVESTTIASGGVNETRVLFNFCPLWDGYAKTAVFYQNMREPYYAMINDENIALIPWEVVKNPGFMYFGVFGIKEGVNRTSEVLTVRIVPGAITAEIAPADPTPDIYIQILSDYNTIKERMVAVDQNTAASAAAAKLSADNASASETHVGEMKTEVETLVNGFDTHVGEMKTEVDELTETCKTEIDEFTEARKNEIDVFAGEQEGELRADLDKLRESVIYGKGKNLLKIKDEIQTRNGVTFTVNADGSITVNGTATSDIYIAVGQATLYAGGNYILTGNGSPEYSLGLYVDSSDVTGATWQRETPAHFSATATGKFSVNIYVATGYTVSNLTFYPMIRLASETDDTYEPYYEGLKSLTDRGMELLWENASPTSEFPDQEISLPTLSNYKTIAIETARGTFAKNTTPDYLYMTGAVSWSTDDSTLTYRTAEIKNNSVWFSHGYARTLHDNRMQVSNNEYIPIKIYGIKGVST